MRHTTLLIALLLILSMGACQREQPQPLPSSVQEVLSNLKSQVQLDRNISYMADIKLGLLEKEIAQGRGDAPQFRLEYAVCLLNNGLTSQAILELESIKKSQENGSDASFIYSVDKQLAITYLRMGEQENCVGKSNAASCLFPLKPEATYIDKTGPKQAIPIFEKLLALNPKDIEARWLLNLAYMTLGTYPSQVPEKWRIPSEQFQSRNSIGHFEDMADSLGLAHLGLSGGVIMDDFNNDGALDIVLSEVYFDRQLKFYRNNGDGTFSDQTETAGILGELGGLHMIQADYNNDGWLDFFILRGAWFNVNGRHPNSLLRNNGDGTFTDVTLESGLYSLYPTQSGVWGDFNRDGWIDLLIANESNSHFEAPIEFFVNNQDGTFTNVAKQAGLDQLGYFKGVTLVDYNNDLWPDVFITYLKGENLLLKNAGINEKGMVLFEDVSSKAGIQNPRKNFPCWSWDYDNNGLEDLLAIPYSFDHTSMFNDLMGMEISDFEGIGFYRNNGDGTFTNIADQVALNRPYYAMAGNFDDFDNDGFLDFYLGTGSPSMETLVPNRMVRNVGGIYFEDITFSADVGHLQKGHSIAIGDIDNDGDQDMYVVLGGIFVSDIFQNPVLINPGQGNNWVNLKLIGKKSNRSAIGSKIMLVVSEGEKERSLYRTVSSGGSFGSSSLQQEIGIGKAEHILMIRITWAGSGVVEEFENIEVNQAYHIVEGQGIIESPNFNQIEL